MADYSAYIPSVGSTTYPTQISNFITISEAFDTEIEVARNGEVNLLAGINLKLSLIGGAMTGTITNFTSTGIDDNAIANAITIDSSENVSFSGNVKIATTNPLFTLSTVNTGASRISFHDETDTAIFELGYRDIDSTFRLSVGDLVSGTVALLLDNSANITFGGNVSLPDYKFLNIGTGDDFWIRHIEILVEAKNTTGDFYITEAVNSGILYLRSSNSAGLIKTGIEIGGATPNVKLYYDGTEACRTRTGGLEFGTFSSTGATIGLRVTDGEITSSHNSTGTDNHTIFYNPNGQVGSISTNGTTTSYNTTSDKTKKKSFGLITNPFGVLDKFDIHDAAFLTDLDDRKMMIMAQDVMPHYPQAVSHNEEDDTWGADYGQFSPLALACIKDLHNRVKQLEAA